MHEVLFIKFHRFVAFLNKHIVYELGNCFSNSGLNYQKRIFVGHLTDRGLVTFPTVFQNATYQPAHITRTIFKQPNELLTPVFPKLQNIFSCKIKT